MADPLPKNKKDLGNEKGSPCQKDIDLLAEFSNSFEYPEINFSQWSQTHADLDLKIPVFFTADELKHGCLKSINYSYSVLSEGKSVKNKSKIEFTVPRETQVGDELKLESKGDIREDRRGHLFIIIKSK